MKKLWKSGAALAMSVAFIVSSAACGAPIDNSGESSSSSGGKENSALSTEYVAKALEQFASAKSVKISINAETAVYAGRVNNANSETQVTANDTQTIQGEILLSETETGVDMSLNVTGSTKDNATSETTDVSASVYVLGDNVYVYDEDCGAYIMQSLSSLIENAQPDIFDALSMADLEGMTADIDTAEMIGMLASLLDEYGTVNETSASVSLSYDASLMLNLLIAQINGIDETTKTLEEAIDDLLRLVGDVRVDDLLDAVKPLGALTLTQAAAQIDALLTSYDVSLKDIKDAAIQEIGEETFEQLVASGSLTQAQADALKTGTIAEVLAAFDAADMTVNALIGLLISSSGGTEVPDTPADVVEPGKESEWTSMYAAGAAAETEPFDLAVFIEDTVKPYLKNTTLAEADIYLPELDGVSVTKAKANAQIVLEKTAVKTMEMSYEFGCTRRVNASDGFATTKVDLKGSIALEELSASPVDIGLPANAKVVYALWTENWKAYADSEEYRAHISFYSPVFEEETLKYYGEICIADPQSASVITYAFEYTPAVSADAQSVSVTVLSANWYSAQIPEWKTLTDEELKALLGGKVTLTLGIDAGVVDVSAFPMYEPSAQ